MPPTNQVVTVKRKPRHLFVRYAVPDPWTGLAIRRHGCKSCTQIWMMQVRRLGAANAQPHQEVGDNWLELILSFMLTVSVIVPVALADPNKTHKALCFLEWSARVCHSDQRSWQQLQFPVLLSSAGSLWCAIWLEVIPKSMNKSLYLQGAAIQTKGYQWRLPIPHQQRFGTVSATLQRVRLSLPCHRSICKCIKKCTMLQKMKPQATGGNDAAEPEWIFGRPKPGVPRQTFTFDLSLYGHSQIEKRARFYPVVPDAMRRSNGSTHLRSGRGAF